MVIGIDVCQEMGSIFNSSILAFWIQLEKTATSFNLPLLGLPLLYSSTTFQRVMNLQIRQFEVKDTEAAIRLANDYALFDGPISESDLTITHGFPEGVLVAEEGNNIVGFIYGYFKDVPSSVLETWGVSKVATIELLVVHSGYTGKGIGTLLLERLIDIFKQAGTHMIGLTCPVKAVEARQLYENHGFEISAYHMRKRLD
jgi:GNAT superfamily N-acetyltransferase